MKIAFYTLGCKVNQYETQAISEKFKALGYDIVDFDEEADIYVINTCTVTNISDRKSRQAIKKAKRISPDSIIIVMGCYSQVYPEEVQKLEDVDIVIGTRDRKEIVNYINNYLRERKRIVAVTNEYKRSVFEDLEISYFAERTRAFLKIEEGCEQFCSYCIIPFARGSVVSRKISDIIDEVKRLVENGYKEFVITGINISAYGKDLEYKNSLIDVIEAVNKVEGVKRIRLSSLEPIIMDDNFIKRLTQIEKLCHHLHLSLQSGSDKILKLMNRQYTTEQYLNIVNNIQKYWYDVAFTTDIIVGFPGENDDDFNQTVSFVKKVGFSRIHVFRFSPKKGTKAFVMPDQVPANIKEKRSQQLKEVSQELSLDFHKRYVGKDLDVLIEQKSDVDGYMEGYSNNYIRVLVEKSEFIKTGEIYNVIVEKAYKNFVVGYIKNI